MKHGQSKQSSPAIKATVYGMATHIFSRQSKKKIAVKVQDYDNSVLGSVRCFSGGLYGTRNSDQLRYLLRNSTEDYSKTNGVACYQKVFCSSTIMQGLTLLQRLGSQSNLLADRFWTMHHTAPTLRRAIYTFSGT
ncbi:hypothetical protein TNCV_4598601 [Trichonephila clavipes]|nr:hypothetical protein TNCV_4598601 [Trichonephila clavipes]